MQQCSTKHACGAGSSEEYSEVCENCGHAYGERSCAFEEKIFYLAKAAKHELLKEKMKKALEERMGTKLDKVAEISVEAFLMHFRQEMEGKKAFWQFKESLFETFKE